VFLEAPPADLLPRVGGQDHRPLLRDDPAGVLRQMDEVRRPLYEQTADFVIDAASRGPDDVVDEILKLVGT
jgi:shikimate kinase